VQFHDRQTADWLGFSPCCLVESICIYRFKSRKIFTEDSISSFNLVSRSLCILSSCIRMTLNEVRRMSRRVRQRVSWPRFLAETSGCRQDNKVLLTPSRDVNKRASGRDFSLRVFLLQKQHHPSPHQQPHDTNPQRPAFARQILSFSYFNPHRVFRSC
jgi:hypothetical protein